MKPVDKDTADELMEEEDDDVQFRGNQDLWKVLTKAWSDEESWSDTTAVMQVPGGVMMRCTYYAEDVTSMAMQFIPGARIVVDDDGKVHLE